MKVNVSECCIEISENTLKELLAKVEKFREINPNICEDLFPNGDMDISSYIWELAKRGTLSFKIGRNEVRVIRSEVNPNQERYSVIESFCNRKDWKY